MKRIILAGAFALAACSTEPAAENVANEAAANTVSTNVLPPADQPEPVVNAAAPDANAAAGETAAESGRSRPDRPYQPLPAEPSPPPPVDAHEGHATNNMQH